MRKEIIGTEDDRTHCVNFKELNVGNRDEQCRYSYWI